MTYDVDRIRARIPALADGTAYFDGPGGTQTPDVVAAAIASALMAGLSNRGRTTAAIFRRLGKSSVTRQS